MSKLICPFCNETELEKGIELQGGGFILGCPKCKKFTHDIFWQALIDIKNKLDNEKQHEKIMAEAIQHNLETEQRLVQECMKAEKKLDIAVNPFASEQIIRTIPEKGIVPLPIVGGQAEQKDKR